MVISQSGRSPDIVEQAAQAKRAGAVVVAIVNAEDAPLCAHADWVIAMHAGSEQAVAASKSYLASLTVLLHIAAQWQQDTELLTALQQFPHYLEAHAQPPLLVQPSALQDLQHCIVLGRGFGYAIAREVALKLKEVLGLHAEAFSSAEFLHGPITLIRHPLTIIDLTIGDESAAAHQQQMREIAARGAQIIPWHSDTAIHPRLQPLELMWRFYQALEHMARSRGLNPDAPPGLKKITETY
jgi:glucosamine--fructose-6-phosphate aminotransferase (isomerizing)